MNTDRIPVVIDCDPGVDDSFAIAMANAAPGFVLRAITAVEGNVPARLTRRNALCVAEALGIDCRVGFGAELPLRKSYTRDASVVHGTSGLGGIEFPACRRQPDPMPAWELIYDEAVKAGGRLVLFAIGPLTNIALALRSHPDLPQYIDRFCIMGGGTFGNVTETAEFNIWVDPTAAHEVFEKLPVYMVGLNATHAAAISPADFDEMIAICRRSPRNWLLRQLAEFSKTNSLNAGCDNHIIHDALAIAAMLSPTVVQFEHCHVRVEDGDDAPNNGQTVIDRTGSSGQPANCHVAMGVEQPQFVLMLKAMCEFYNK